MDKKEYMPSLVGISLISAVALFLWNSGLTDLPRVLVWIVNIIILLLWAAVFIVFVLQVSGYGYRIRLLRRMKLDDLWYTADENPRCRRVVISKKAYSFIMKDVDEKKPMETKGDLYGQIDTLGIWHVIDATGPEKDAILSETRVIFSIIRRDDDFSKIYGKTIQLLGMWHSHPNYMNVFSENDNMTNHLFANEVGKGTISFLVTTFPRNKLTCYYLNQETGEYHLLKYKIEKE